MQNNGAKTAVLTYAAWLDNARQTSGEQHLVRKVFKADNTAVSFNKISYATCKILPDHVEQE